MVTPNMYLKDIYSMSLEEKRELSKRLSMLESKQSPNLDYDLVTISALPRSHGFISMAHQLDSDRVWSELKGFVKLLKPLVPEEESLNELKNEARVEEKNGFFFQTEATQGTRVRQPNPSAVVVNTTAKTGSELPKTEQPKDTLVAPKGTRPKHFDEWLEKMSPELQEKVEELKDLHTKKVYYRQMVEQLADEPNHSKQDMSYASTLAVTYEKKIQAIYDLADIEWAELCGQKVSDEAKQIVIQQEMDADKVLKKANKTSANAEGTVADSDKPETEVSTPVVEGQDREKAKPISEMTEAELNELTVMQLLEADLDEGPKKYFINRRVENGRKCLLKLNENSRDDAKETAKIYVAEILAAGKEISPKGKENLKAAGINLAELGIKEEE